MAARVDFNAKDFEDMITYHGYRVKWEQAMNCPCIDTTTGHAVEGCPQCDSRGKYYFASSEIKAIITRQNKELQIGDAIGVLEPGDAYLTTYAQNQLTKWDRVTNLDSVMVDHETIVHDSVYGDWLTFVPVGSVFGIYQPNRDANIVTLRQGIDFSVAADGKIDWIGGVGTVTPAEGHGVSFRYNHHPVWLVISNINVIRDTFIKEGNPVDTHTQLPIRVQIRLESLGTAIANS